MDDVTTDSSNVATRVTWDVTRDILSTKGFPLAGIVKSYAAHKCVHQEHRDVFAFNAAIGGPLLRKEIKSLPEIKTCWNATSLFEEKLPRKLTGLPNRVYFKDIPTVGTAIRVLRRGTYWFKRAERNRATLLQTVRLLGGCGLKLSSAYKLKLSPAGAAGLKNIVATIDGTTVQLCLAFPDKPEIQSWDYFDNVVNNMYCNLVQDWLAPRVSKRVSYYEKLKSLKGQIKKMVFSEEGKPSDVVIPRELTYFVKPVSYLGQKNVITAFRAGILIQTRSVGLPPPTLFLRTFQKFEETVTSKCDPPPRGHQSAIAMATRRVYRRLVEQENLPLVVSKALRRAKISLSDSADLNFTREVGGKYEAFRTLNMEIKGRPVYRVDLENGSLTQELIEETLDNIGTRAFHYTMAKAIRNEIPDLMTVRTCGVLEPGKVREITVSDIHHAVLLHPISHILLDVLSVAPSSASGIGAANHAFEFYKRLNHKNPAAGFIFNVDPWVLSSDLETATDHISPYIVKIILDIFMGPHCLGVPKFYRNTVVFLLTSPRTVVDTATLRSFQTTRGCLMGDPVTKFVMHMVHLVGKEITLSLYE